MEKSDEPSIYRSKKIVYCWGEGFVCRCPGGIQERIVGFELEIMDFWGAEALRKAVNELGGVNFQRKIR
jgi:hypothetical protein